PRAVAELLELRIADAGLQEALLHDLFGDLRAAGLRDLRARRVELVALDDRFVTEIAGRELLAELVPRAVAVRLHLLALADASRHEARLHGGLGHLRLARGHHARMAVDEVLLGGAFAAHLRFADRRDHLAPRAFAEGPGAFAAFRAAVEESLLVR